MTHAPQDLSPITRVIDLSDLTEAGREIDLAATPEELIRLAGWAGVISVKSFDAKALLRRRSADRFTVAAEFVAVIEQRCVVSLEPVISEIKLSVRRVLTYGEPSAEMRVGELTLAAGDEETPDVIDSLRYDLCGPILEEFSLAIDPYPRKDGVHYESGNAGAEPQESPFAVLENLKKTLKP